MKILATIAVACLIPLATITAANAAPAGTLDKTYSGDGITKSGFYNDGGSVLVDPSGRVIVGGRVGGGLKQHPALVRYTADGTLDKTFSGDGKMTLPIVSHVSALAWRNNEILAQCEHTLFSVTQTGKIDMSFGGGTGEVVLPEAASSMEVDQATGIIYLLLGDRIERLDGTKATFASLPTQDGWSSLALSSNAKALYVGGDGTSPSEPTDIYVQTVERFDATTLKPSWSPHITYSNSYENGWFTEVSAMAVSPTSGDVTLVGDGHQNVTDLQFGYVMRVTPAGVIDMTNSFGPPSNIDALEAYPRSLALEGNKTVVAGVAIGDVTLGYTALPTFTLWRLDLDGAVDPTFGVDGGAATPAAGDEADDVVIWGSKIVVAGGLYTARFLG